MDRTHIQQRKIKRHLPYIVATLTITLIVSILYFKWYDLKPLDKKNATIIEQLMHGNERFSAGHPRHPDESIKHRAKVASGQHPKAIVVTCSDSRLSPELIFDQGLGDLFVIRTAGNIISEMEMGSIEYAVEHLGAKHLIIMGHENCGAVQALLESVPAPGHIHSIVDSLSVEKEMQHALAHHNMEEAVVANVIHQMSAITSDPLFLEKKENTPLHVLGLLYSMSSGKVSIIDSFSIK
jgi:carbonic anhydrase